MPRDNGDTPAGRCKHCDGRLMRTPSGVVYHVKPGADHEPEPK